MGARANYLREMGITRWVDASRNSPAAHPSVAAGSHAASQTDGTLETLRGRVAACELCGLHASRQQTVFGLGPVPAEWMVVGEAPGAEEDRQGVPFVGRAGALLTEMLVALGLQRNAVYVANVLKCRPPDNRDPQGAEVEHCLPYLTKQIHLVKPRVILALGRFAAQALLGSRDSLGQLRGRVHRFGKEGTPIVATYHPAYLLRSPAEKRSAWVDLKQARVTYQQECTSST